MNDRKFRDEQNTHISMELQRISGIDLQRQDCFRESSSLIDLKKHVSCRLLKYCKDYNRTKQQCESVGDKFKYNNVFKKDEHESEQIALEKINDLKKQLHSPSEPDLSRRYVSSRYMDRRICSQRSSRANISKMNTKTFWSPKSSKMG